MNSREWRATLALGAVYALRMLGVFMILPVFGLYATALPEHPSEQLIGFALTASGITQALFQIPMGMLIFALGSLIAGLSKSIEWIAVGRAVQGAGAISSAVTALLADVTREE